jgi:kinesin family protein C1
MSLSRELGQLKEQAAVLESRVAAKDAEVLSTKDAVLQLEVERELRARSEVREEAERRERIATCAQLMATQAECGQRLREAETAAALEMQAMKNQVAELQRKGEEAKAEIEKQADRIMGLESEDRQIRQALEQASATYDAEAVQQLGKVTGELEILRKRLREINESKDRDDSLAARKINELEEQLKAEEIHRRKLHNIIQELRGNVRVFARLRPFLPSDQVDLSKMPDSCIQVTCFTFEVIKFLYGEIY